jgi:iron transport multicopper oxidase
MFPIPFNLVSLSITALDSGIITSEIPDVTSSITYDSSAPLIDLGFVDAYPDFDDTVLVPVVVEPMLPTDRTVELEVSFKTVEDGTNRAMFNNVSYQIPLVPTVLSVLTLGSNATVPTAYGTGGIVLDHLSAVQIIVKNGDTGKHPLYVLLLLRGMNEHLNLNCSHIHGHKVQLVNRAQNYSSTDPTLNPPIVEGQANPMRRDTFQVPAGASIALRLVADNPGAWLFHCVYLTISFSRLSADHITGHIEWHLESGLAVTFIEAPLEMQQRARTIQAPPYSLSQQCLAQGLPASGNAAGHASTTDLSGGRSRSKRVAHEGVLGA